MTWWMAQPSVADPLFHEFVAEGQLSGKITLRHRSGKKIRVRYSSAWSPMAARLPTGSRWTRRAPLDSPPAPSISLPACFRLSAPPAACPAALRQPANVSRASRDSRAAKPFRVDHIHVFYLPVPPWPRWQSMKRTAGFCCAKQQQAKIMAQKACSQVHQAQQCREIFPARTPWPAWPRPVGVCPCFFPLNLEHGITAVQRHARHLKKIGVSSPAFLGFHFRAIHQLGVRAHARRHQEISLLRPTLSLRAHQPARIPRLICQQLLCRFHGIEGSPRSDASRFPLPSGTSAERNVHERSLSAGAHDPIERLVGRAVAAASDYRIKAPPQASCTCCMALPVCVVAQVSVSTPAARNTSRPRASILRPLGASAAGSRVVDKECSSHGWI